MKIIVIGIGKVGKVIIEHVCQEGHNIIAIDNNAKVINQLVEQYDIMGVTGNGASYDIQVEADVSTADLVIAVTSSDEVNILCCLLSKKLGAKSTIARVRNREYLKQTEFMQNDLGLSMTINPELEAANEIARIINFPSALKVEQFAKGEVDLMEVIIDENSELVGLSLQQIMLKYQVKVLVCAVQRGSDIFIPTGNFILEAKDKIHITAARKDIIDFLRKTSQYKERIKNVMIIGGSMISYYLAQELLKEHYHVKIIEIDEKICLQLSELLPEATIINGDGSDQEILLDEKIDMVDACVALTGIDEENIIISMYAQKRKVSKVIAKVNRNSFASMLESVELASIISPKEITAIRVISYIRAKSNDRGSNIITLHKLLNNRVEVLEFKAKNTSKVIDIPLKNLKMRPNCLIASIIHNKEVIIPRGNNTITSGDSVIVVTTNSYLNELDEIVEG